MEAILSFITREDLRAWLEAHHLQEEGIWLEFYKDGRPAITLKQAQEEALCYGWVDSRMKGVDEVRYRLKFSKRRKKSRWSARNKELAQQLMASGRMTPSGQAAIEEARTNGAWEAVDPRPAFEDPEGFLRVLGDHQEAFARGSCAPAVRRASRVDLAHRRRAPGGWRERARGATGRGAAAP